MSSKDAVRPAGGEACEESVPDGAAGDPEERASRDRGEDQEARQVSCAITLLDSVACFTYFIVIGYSIQVKEFLTHNSIWTEHLKPNIVAHNPLQRRFQSVVGMGGFYSLLTAQDGYSVVARISFYKFCEDVDAKTLGLFAHFVDFCFRLRLCDEAQVQYHTILCTLPLYKVLICRIVFII